MLRLTRTTKELKGPLYKHNAGFELKTWFELKRMRVKVQHLLAYERVETSDTQANKLVRYTDKLLTICKKGPICEKTSIVGNDGQLIASLEALPPRYITENHILPEDSQNYSPQDFSWKLGGEYWGYDHVFDSDRRFGKTTDDRDQSIEQYTRDMLDWWTEGQYQEELQEKIYKVFLPRYHNRLGPNANKHTKWATVSSIHYESRRKTDGLPTYKGGTFDGGKFNAGTLDGWHGMGHGEVTVVDLLYNPWPPLPTFQENDEDMSHSFVNQMMNTAFPGRVRFTPKEIQNYRDTLSFKDTGTGRVR